MPLDLHDPSRGVYETILEGLGNTPLVRLRRVTKGLRMPVYGKAEFLSPGGSVKDRIGLAIIEAAEASGELKPGGTVVEATAGNTGVALAMAATIKGYKMICALPDKMSTEKVRLLRAFGSQIVITPTAVPPDHPDYYVNTARKIAEQTPNAIFANQFYNRANTEAHYATTGPEVWAQTRGTVAAFVAGAATGGTVSGVGRYLKEQDPSIRVVVADPYGSILRTYQETGRVDEGTPYMVEGIGMDKVPSTLDIEYIDEVRNVSDKQAFQMARRLTREEALFVGGSTGSIIHVALEIAREIDDPERCVVGVLCDLGERYLSKFHDDEWMRENRMLDDGAVGVGHMLSQKRRDELPPLIHIGIDGTVREALQLMEEHNVSQIPVLDAGIQRGSLSEGTLLNRVLTHPEALDSGVDEYLEAPFTTIDEDANLKSVIEILAAGNSALLVKRGTEFVGILTKFDVLHYLTNGGQQ